MIIAQISDTHHRAGYAGCRSEIVGPRHTVADINALDPLPDAIVHTGDVAHNGRQDEYAEAVAILAEARAPVYVLAGNKDAEVKSARGVLCWRILCAGFRLHPVRDRPLSGAADRSRYPELGQQGRLLPRAAQTFDRPAQSRHRLQTHRGFHAPSAVPGDRGAGAVSLRESGSNVAAAQRLA